MTKSPYTRLVHVMDEATHIPMMVTVPALVPSEQGRGVFARAGYGDFKGYVIVTDLLNNEGHSDPFQWSDWTRMAFHLTLRKDPAVLEAVMGDNDGAYFHVQAYREAYTKELA